MSRKPEHRSPHDLEFTQAPLEREVLRVPVHEDQHDLRLVGVEEVDHPSVSFAKLRLQDLHIGVEPVYRPLDDRHEQVVRSSVGHNGPGQLAIHLTDPNSSCN